MKKKVLCLAALSVIMLGSIASCNNNNNNSSSSATSTVSHEVTITISGASDGKYEVGGSIEVGVKLDGSFATKGASLTASNDNVTIGEGIAGLYTVDLAKAGEVTLTAKVSVDGQEYSASETITLTDIVVTSIADAKKLDDGTSVTVRGKVTAISGKSAYIADSTGGLYIYNWNYNSDGSDTAISDSTWTLGQTVEVKANVASNAEGKQLSNYSNGRINGTYAKTTTAAVTYSVANLDETGFKALKSTDAGNVYTFTATYVSGTPNTGSAVSCKFKIGDTSVTLRTDKYDKVGISTTLVAGREYSITTPLSWYYGAQFAFLGIGTTISPVEVINPTGVSISAASSVLVGTSIPLSYTLTPSGASADVTYAITSGSEYATINGSTLTGVKVGTVTITGSVTVDGTTITSNPITVSVIDLTDSVKINTVTVNNSYYVKGIVAAKHDKGFVLADDTGAIYVHDYGNCNAAIGDYASIKGVVSSYNGALQFTYSSSTHVYNKLTDTTGKPTLASAIDLTSSIADSFKTVGESVSLNKLYKWTTTVGKLNGYLTFNVSGSTTTIEAQYTTFDVKEGTTYEVEGYFTGYNTSYNYANFIFTSVTAK